LPEERPRRRREASPAPRPGERDIPGRMSRTTAEAGGGGQRRRRPSSESAAATVAMGPAGHPAHSPGHGRLHRIRVLSTLNIVSTAAGVRALAPRRPRQRFRPQLAPAEVHRRPHRRPQLAPAGRRDRGTATAIRARDRCPARSPARSRYWSPKRYLTARPRGVERTRSSNANPARPTKRSEVEHDQDPSSAGSPPGRSMTPPAEGGPAMGMPRHEASDPRRPSNVAPPHGR